MPENTKVPTSPSRSVPQTVREWDPFTSIDDLFNSLRSGFWRSRLDNLPDIEPFWRRRGEVALAPAVDIAETDKQYEITAELPGLQPENVDVKLANGVLTIKGEKKEEREEKKEGYHLSERRFGSFQRSFAVPEGIDADKIAADFKNGVLKITMPKTPEVQQKEKKIAIKAS